MSSQIQAAGKEVLLDRSGVPAEIDRELGLHVDYLKTLADWGVRFLKRSVARANRADPPNVVLLTTLYHQVLCFLDAVHLQLQAGAVHASVTSLRPLFEAELSIRWILKNGKERWGRQYYVSDLRQQRTWAAMLVPGTPERERLERDGKDLILELLEDEDKVEAAHREMTTIDEHFDDNPRLAEISREFDRYKDKRGWDREPRWYQPGGPNSLADLAVRLGRGQQFRILYRQWSEVAHGSRTRGHVQVQPEQRRLVIEPIRTPENLDEVLRLARSLAERATLILVEEYEPEKRAQFANKVTEEWAEQRAMPDVEVRQEIVEGF